ncbi:MAG: phosphatidate cytidylyltransferase [Bacteroidota bacterium]|nr:phosphatidate cytidylyltransferase [Bacteroidota bacterium]
MALNLKTLATRSASAAVFVVLLVGCVYWNYISFSLFFFAVSMIGLNEFFKIAEKMGAKPFKVVGFILGALIYFSFINPGGHSLISYIDSFVFINDLRWFSKTLLISGPFIMLTVALFSKKENSIKNALFTLGGIMYAIIPFALLNQTVCFSGHYSEGLFKPMLILGVIFLIWSNDTFAYLGGSLFGKHKMIERVSPGKTWEGTITGVLITFGLSFLFNDHIYKLEGIYGWTLIGIMVPILATIGDLVESKLKREAGIKDSGNIMPGHGGILDRFDSLIFVSPFIYVIFVFFRFH